MTGPPLNKISDVLWEIPESYKKGMNVPARVYADEELLKGMEGAVFDQLTNTACLPGIQKYALCMADGHSGYGFPVGGVAAFDPEEGGVISPGGVGFDINCGMRLIKTNMTTEQVMPRIKNIVDELFKKVPTGVGCKGFLKLSEKQFKGALTGGARWAVEQGYGWEKDLEFIEDKGILQNADTTKVSQTAIKRGVNQLGTLGSGNHYLEVQIVTAGKIYDSKIAKKFGITGEDQVVLMIHCGSRGVGHQICSDYTKLFNTKQKEYNFEIPDKQLACAPYNSKDAQDYVKAMNCGANMALANRQIIMHRIREVFEKEYREDAESLGIELIYDVSHNIAKEENYKIDGKNKNLIVHRKGATRSFGPENQELPKKYQETGQPVIVGGSMETGSYLLAGTRKAEEETFGSTLHGSGRTMSRTQARKEAKGEKLYSDMLAKGIYIKARSMQGLAEEAGKAYKSIDKVTEIMDTAGISKRVCALRPIGNIKG
ncbi:RtcB family protein [Candidatus Woesearchaeota archaeon]|nr:RtcB family protein [Candidatus Woesearchaeota archaeon]